MEVNTMINKEILKVYWIKDYENKQPGLVVVEFNNLREISLANDEIEALQNAITIIDYLLSNRDNP